MLGLWGRMWRRRRRAKLWARRFFVFCAVFFGLALSVELVSRWFVPEAPLVLADDEVELWTIGGSTSLAMPFDHETSLGGMISAQLGGRLGDRTIVVRSIAEMGASLYPQFVRFRRAVWKRNSERPGAVIIYSGHNECFCDNEEEPGFLDRFVVGLERAWPTNSLALSELLLARRESRRGRGTCTGLDHYEAALRRVIETALDNGLTPVLSTVIGNIVGVEPPCPDDGEQDGPLADYREAERLAGMGRFDEARELYWQASDRSRTLFFGRARRSQNEVIRRLAAEYDLALFDAVVAFEAASLHGLVGWELFADGHHPNLTGYRILSEGLAARLADAFQATERPSLRSRSDFIEALGLAPDEIALGRLYSAEMVFWQASRHPKPTNRLRGARELVQRAIPELPSSFEYRLFAALVDAGTDGELFADAAAISTLHRLGVSRVVRKEERTPMDTSAWEEVSAALAPHLPPPRLTELDALFKSR